MANPNNFPDFGVTDVPVGDVLTYPRRIYIQYLKSLLGNPDLFGPGCNEWLFLADGAGNPTKDSKVAIVDTFSEELLTPTDRLLITVSRADAGWQDIGINRGFVEGDNYGVGPQTFADISEMTIAISVWGRQPIPTERLANFVWLALRQHLKYIKRCSKLTHITTPSAGPITPVKRDGRFDLVIVQLTFRVTMTHSWAQTNTGDFVEPSGKICIGLQFPSSSMM